MSPADPWTAPWSEGKWRKTPYGCSFGPSPPPPTARELAEYARWQKEKRARDCFVGPTPVVARQAWLLRYGCGLPVDKIAPLLRVRVGSVRKYLARVEDAIARQWRREEKSRRGWVKKPDKPRGAKWRDFHLPMVAHQDRAPTTPARQRVWYKHHAQASLDGRFWSVRCHTSHKTIRVIATFRFGEAIEQSAVRELEHVCAADHVWDPAGQTLVLG